MLEQAAQSIDDLFTEDKHGEPSVSPFVSENATSSPTLPEEPNLSQDAHTAPVQDGTKTASLRPSDPQKKPDIEKKTATLKMNSNPQRAMLYLNDDYKGLTPLDLEVTATKYEVKLELQGHSDWKAQLDLSKGGVIPLTITLLPE